MPYGETGRSGASSVTGRPSLSPYTEEVDAMTVGTGRRARPPCRARVATRFCRTYVENPGPQLDRTPGWPARWNTISTPLRRGSRATVARSSAYRLNHGCASDAAIFARLTPGS